MPRTSKNEAPAVIDIPEVEITNSIWMATP
jgi:hypothetical protein